MKLRKKIILLTMTIINVFVIGTNVYAADNKTALAVGCNYNDGVNTIVDANNAYNAYSSMNLSYVAKFVTPTKYTLMGSFGNGRAYLNSGIVFLSGHGNKDLMAFKQTNGTTFYIQDNNTTSGNYIGIGNYVNSNNALVVFAGCKTSEGLDNIATYVVEKGAKASIGWTTSVGAGSHTNWLKRFNNKIKDKTTSVKAAKNSADGHIYVDSRVKNGYIWGDRNHNPWYYMNSSKSLNVSTKDTISNSINLDQNEYIIKVDKKDNNLKSVVEKYIINNLDNTFNKNDYIIEVNGTDTKYYDYVLYVNGVRTDYGYTIAEKEDGLITIHQNIKKGDIEKIKNKIIELSNTKNLNNKSSENSLIKKVNNEYKNTNITTYLITNYYDSTDQTLYKIGIFDIEFKDGTFASVEYRKEI